MTVSGRVVNFGTDGREGDEQLLREHMIPKWTDLH